MAEWAGAGASQKAIVGLNPIANAPIGIFNIPNKFAFPVDSFLACITFSFLPVMTTVRLWSFAMLISIVTSKNMQIQDT